MFSLPVCQRVLALPVQAMPPLPFKEVSPVAMLVFWILSLQDWKKRSKHRKVITLLVDCREKYSESNKGSVPCSGCDAEGGR